MAQQGSDTISIQKVIGILSILTTIIIGVLLIVNTFATTTDLADTKTISDNSYFPKTEGMLLERRVVDLEIDFDKAMGILMEDHELLREMQISNREEHKAILKELKNLQK